MENLKTTTKARCEMTNESETVREVCADKIELPIAEINLDWHVACLMLRDELQRMKREMAAKDEMARIASQSAQARFDEELADKDAEIARLNDELFAYAGGHVITGAERCLREKNKQLEAEIARLKAALKPVMECSKELAPFLGQKDVMSERWSVEPELAVREAQRIMKEGGEK